MVREAILDAQKQCFFPEVCRLLETLRGERTVYYTQPLLPELLWDAYTVLYRRLMAEAALIRGGGATGGVVQWLEAERFLWERLLDAPYGSIELIRGDEALRTIGHAVVRLRRMQGR